MEAIRRQFVRLARWSGLVLGLGSVLGVPAAIAPPPFISPAPPTDWLTHGEYPLTATVTGDRRIVRLRWSLRQAVGDALGHGVLPTEICVPHRTHGDICSASGRPARWCEGGVLVFDAEYIPDPVAGQVNTTQHVTRRFPVHVTTPAPAAPTGLALIGEHGWRIENRFDVGLDSEALTAVHRSLVSSTEFAQCQTRGGWARAASSGNARAIPRRSPGSPFQGPAPGAWRSRFADGLGHVDLDDAATLHELRLDTDAPRLTFLTRDPGDPARIELSVTDEGSGGRFIAIEARRRGEPTWRTLSVSTNTSRLTALLDDDDLPARYLRGARPCDRCRR